MSASSRRQLLVGTTAALVASSVFMARTAGSSLDQLDTGQIGQLLARITVAAQTPASHTWPEANWIHDAR